MREQHDPAARMAEMREHDRTARRVAHMLASRWNVWDWRDVRDVLRLRIPPYRWQRCVPLPRFALGVRVFYEGHVLCCGWWGLRG